MRVKSIFINGAMPGAPAVFTTKVKEDEGTVDIHPEGTTWVVDLYQGGKVTERWVVPSHMCIVCWEPVPTLEMN